MEGHTDTILIDCNRETSAEKVTGSTDTSVFTCKVSDGMKLKVGDIVSVHSGFISERGCGAGDVIEITGRDLKEETEIEYTERTLYQSIIAPELNNGSDMIHPPLATLPPYNARCWTNRNVKEKRRLADNKISMSISYYKTNNGEGHVMLPRRYSHQIGFTGAGQKIATADYNYDASGQKFYWAANLLGVGTGANYDNYRQGRTMGIDYYGDKVLEEDVKYLKDGTLPPFIAADPNANPPVAGQSGSARNIEFASAMTDKLYKYKVDNQRFTIMVCEDNWYGQPSQFGAHLPNVTKYGDTTRGDDIDITVTSAGRDTFKGQTAIETRHYRDPCLMDWVIYKEIKDIEIETGFQSPESIATQITDQLSAREDFQTIFSTVGGMNKMSAEDFVGAEQGYVTTFSESACYKAFPSASAQEFIAPAWKLYWEGLKVSSEIPKTDAGYNLLRQVQYIQQYSTIGVKRPELWEAGRELIKNASQVNAGEYDLQTAGNVWYPVGDTTVSATNKSWRNYSPGHLMKGIAYDERESTDNDENLLVTSFLWNDENLLYFKNLFKVQGQDESLFNTDNNCMNRLGGNMAQHNKSTSKHNSRFIHMNTTEAPKGKGATYPHTQLGCDNYEQLPGSTNNPDWTGNLGAQTYIAPIIGTSMPIFIWFDERFEETRYNEAKDQYTQVYGFAQKRTITMPAPVPGVGPFVDQDYEVICFNTSELGGIPDRAWGMDTGVSWAAPTVAEDRYYISADKDGYDVRSAGANRYLTPRRIGYDPHFNAYGTASMLLYTGLLDGDDDAKTYYVDTDAAGSVAKDTRPISHQIKQRYCGANEPTMNWDPDESKFQIQSLHTPEYTGNEINAGDGHADNDPNADAGQPVWILNKKIRKTQFCPDMLPYLSDVTFAGGTAKVPPSNINIEPWHLYDMNGGIFINSFNISEDKWQDSLMGIMGFEYSQFNSDKIVQTRQRRLDESVNLTTTGDTLTTNAFVKSSDLVQFRTNVYGAPFYNSQLPVIETDLTGSGTDHGFYPVVTDQQVTASIEAQKLPRRMLTPYYIIRSDLISDNNYNEDGKALPIIYVVNKENGFGDFFFQNTSETNFTITKDKVITEITTSIHNPNMTLAPTSEGSGIIYKVIRNNNADMNVAEEILNKNKKK